MRAKVKKVNVTTLHRWLFLLEDNFANQYYVMGGDFYDNRKINHPVTKQMLDGFFEGTSVQFEYIEIDGENIVTKISSFC